MISSGGFSPEGTKPLSATYSRDSAGSKWRISRSTESPPTPESNTPTGCSDIALPCPAAAAARVAADAQFTEAAVEGIDQQQSTHQRLTETGQQLERLQCLQAADHAHQRTYDPGLAAAQRHIIAVAVQALVAGTGRSPRIEHADLTLQPDGGAGDQRLAQGNAGGIQRLAGGEVVGAVENQIDPGHGLAQLFAEQPLVQLMDTHLRVERGQPRGRGVGLGSVQISGSMDDLPLQVGQIHPVVIRQPQLADPGTGQIERSRTAQSAHADDQHAAVEQALLTLHVDLLQQNLPAVAQQLFVQHATALR